MFPILIGQAGSQRNMAPLTLAALRDASAFRAGIIEAGMVTDPWIARMPYMAVDGTRVG